MRTDSKDILNGLIARTRRSQPGATLATATVVGLLAIAFLGGCPGSLRDPGRFTDAGASGGASASSGAGGGGGGGGSGSGCPDVPTTILAAKCGLSGCHAGATPAQGLDLKSDGVAARVVGVAAMVCKGTLADPTAPEASVIYTKLTAPSCGDQMPPGVPLPNSEIACVKNWIAAQTPSAAMSSGSSSTGP